MAWLAAAAAFATVSKTARLKLDVSYDNKERRPCRPFIDGIPQSEEDQTNLIKGNLQSQALKSP